MKKVMFLLAVVGSMFTSCSKDSLTDSISSTSGATTDLTSTLVANTDLVNTTNELSAAARGGGGNNGTGDFRGKKGKCDKEINVDSLSDIIKTYIAANYPNATTDKAFKDKDGNTVVLITKEDGTKVGLIFDSTGTFQKEVTGKPDHKKDLTAVDVATLSATITDYISTNYAGSTIDKAFTDKDGNVIVVVKKADGTVTALLFDAAGVFVKELPKHGKGALTTIDVATLPTAVTDYVSTNYVGSTIEKAYTDPNGNILVTVKTATGGKVRLAFDSAGTFIKVIKKK